LSGDDLISAEPAGLKEEDAKPSNFRDFRLIGALCIMLRHLSFALKVYMASSQYAACAFQ